MKTLRILLFLLLPFAFACEKDEAKIADRLDGQWLVTSCFDNSRFDLEGKTISFTADGSAVKLTLSISGQSYSTNCNITAFSDHNANLSISSFSPSYAEEAYLIGTYEIVEESPTATTLKRNNTTDTIKLTKK
ncbi:MAG: hypothetical protein RIS47_1353 [Bacteroidota bacterium]|jgi:hypothetical protein